MTDTVTISLPPAVVDFLSEAELEGDDLTAFEAGTSTAYGGLRVTATLDVHQYLLDCCWVLAGGQGVETSPQERRAYRSYAQRITTAKTEQA
jgi:hypothetical protein